MQWQFSAICGSVWIYSLNVTTITTESVILGYGEETVEENVAFKFVAHPLVEQERLQMGQQRDRRSSDAERKLYDS